VTALEGTKFQKNGGDKVIVAFRSSDARCSVASRVQALYALRTIITNLLNYLEVEGVRRRALPLGRAVTARGCRAVWRGGPSERRPSHDAVCQVHRGTGPGTPSVHPDLAFTHVRQDNRYGALLNFVGVGTSPHRCAAAAPAPNERAERWSSSTEFRLLARALATYLLVRRAPNRAKAKVRAAAAARPHCALRRLHACAQHHFFDWQGLAGTGDPKEREKTLAEFQARVDATQRAVHRDACSPRRLRAQESADKKAYRPYAALVRAALTAAARADGVALRARQVVTLMGRVTSDPGVLHAPSFLDFAAAALFPRLRWPAGWAEADHARDGLLPGVQPPVPRRIEGERARVEGC
jgi:hypothetical protein